MMSRFMGGLLAIGLLLGSACVHADPYGYLEHPPDGSYESGVSLIFGWVCDAEAVSIRVNAVEMPVFYGVERLDTQEICGGAVENGFMTMLNWNELGDGLHTVEARVDGAVLGTARVIVTPLDEPFQRGLSALYTLHDFPESGRGVTVEWQETLQNFVITQRWIEEGEGREEDPVAGAP